MDLITRLEEAILIAVLRLDDDAYFSYNVAWLRGVADATGWSLARPSGAAPK